MNTETAERRIEKKLYSGIDILKLVCAVLVVFLHTYCYDFGIVGGVLKFITNIGVPFFFIASGYFYEKGLSRAENKRQYFCRYFKRIFFMYCIWTALSLPAFIYNLVTTKGYGVPMLCLYVIRAFFLTGSMGVYWYLLSLLYVSFILYYVRIHPKLELPLYIVAVIMFIFGLVYNEGLLVNNMFGILTHVVFSSERNFLMVGLFYMCMGWLISAKNPRLPSMPILLIALSCSIGLMVADFFWIPLSVSPAPAALCLFLVGLKWDCRISPKSSYRIRSLSTGIYLTHFPFIILFDLYLEKGTYIDLPLTLLVCLVVYSLAQLLPENVRKLVFG